MFIRGRPYKAVSGTAEEAGITCPLRKRGRYPPTLPRNVAGRFAPSRRSLIDDPFPWSLSKRRYEQRRRRSSFPRRTRDELLLWFGTWCSLQQACCLNKPLAGRSRSVPNPEPFVAVSSGACFGRIRT